MEESYSEDLANHTDPESCAGSGNTFGEALTGARTGGVLSPEISRHVLGADAILDRGRQHYTDRLGEVCINPAGSETTSMYGNTLRWNREALRSAFIDSPEVHTENSKGVLP